MSLLISRVPFEQVHQRWSEVEPWLAPLADLSDSDCTLQQLQTLVFTKQVMLLISEEAGVVRGACTVVFNNKVSHRAAYVTMIGGRMIADKDSFEQFKALLKTYGATYLEGAVRKSMVRLSTRFGLREKYSIVGMTL